MLDDELRLWKKDHHKYLEWLQKGAPPYRLSFARTVVDDLLDLSMTAPEQEDEFMQNGGYKRGNDGRWTKEPELVIYEPREWHEEALRLLARECGDGGPHYLSLGSWPTSVGVVANGRRYASRKPIVGERAWYGYLADSHRVILFRSVSDREIIEIQEELDILPALEEIPTEG